MKPKLEGSLERHGYTWDLLSPEQAATALEQAGAEVYLLDVYASNNRVYHHLHIDLGDQEVELRWAS